MQCFAACTTPLAPPAARLTSTPRPRELALSALQQTGRSHIAAHLITCKMARIALGGLLGLAIAFVCASQLQNVAAAGLPTKLYIVRFHQSVASSAPAEVQAVFKELYHRHESDVHADWHAVPEAQFERVFSGAAVRMSEAAADWLRQHPAVADIELDQNFHIIEPLDRLPEPVDMLSMSKGHVQRNLGDVNPQQSRRRALQTSSVRTQSGESIQRFGLWSLDRIDQADAYVQLEHEPWLAAMLACWALSNLICCLQAPLLLVLLVRHRWRRRGRVCCG